MATAATTTRRPSGPVLSAAHYRYASPTRVSLSGAGQSVSVSVSSSSRGRRTCMCSPTSHPGSFRCSLHKERATKPPPPHGHGKPTSPPPPLTTTSRLCAAGRRMGSALVRIGAVEGGQCARRALAATARPSPAAAQHRRRVGAGAGAARPRPSRLSAVSVAGDRPGDNGHL
uniref:Serine-rich protein n=1 Tax=Zea mays TaxID=4577 RepID=B6UEW1_MAIZE|nr:serine-rich protein [Zea mays]